MAEKVWKDYRGESRKNYGENLDKDSGICNDQLKAGAIMRIADALELMTKDKDDLVKENLAFKKTNVALQDELKKAILGRDDARHMSSFWEDKANRRLRRVSALRGVITRMKRAR